MGNPGHHGDHRNLLTRTDPTEAAVDVDAVVIPTARHPDVMLRHVRLATQLRCPLIALCSRRSSADLVGHLARAAGIHVVAVDVDVDAGLRLPGFRTSALLAGTKFASPHDLGIKRNVGLALATMAGWRRVMLLDDDITVTRPDDVRAAAALADTYDIVALENVGFPDNSVVCHAIRRVSEVANVGVRQNSFVGAGAMVVPTDRTESFFPDVYNEDWFFMLRDSGIRPVAVTGEVVQLGYDPFADSARAAAEEFGDCMAEGIYSILDDGGHVRDADLAFWDAFLDDRGRLIDRVLAAVPRLRLADHEHQRMVAALREAQSRRECITPQRCVDYVDAWATDVTDWQRFLAELPRAVAPDEALRHLGLTPFTVFPG